MKSALTLAPKLASFRSFALLLALAAAALLPAGTIGAAPAQPEQELAQITRALEGLEAWLESSRRDRAALDAELATSARALGRLARRVRDTDAAIEGIGVEVARLEGEVETLTARELAQREALADGLRSAWLLGRQEPLQLLFNAEAPDRIGRLLTYHRHVSAARRAALDEYATTRDALDASARDLATQRTALTAERAALKRQESLLDTARDQRAEALASLDAEINAGEGRREELEAARARLEALLADLERRAPAPTVSDFASARGAMPWPLEGAPMRTSFGSRLAQGMLTSDGVFLEAGVGTEIRAIHPGRVVFADWMRGFGLLVILDHGNGYMSLYGQTEALLRSAGDWVEAGEVIATAGQSTTQDRPGLYFEIRHDGAPQDPVAWCAERRRA